MLNNPFKVCSSETMLTSSIKTDVISFFVTRKSQKIKTNNEICKYRLRGYVYLLIDLRNFNEVLRKDVTYDNTKSQMDPNPSRFRVTCNKR